jgi:hypothetical protein
MNEQCQYESQNIAQQLETIDIQNGFWSINFLEDFRNGNSHCRIVHYTDQFAFFVNCNGRTFINHLFQLILHFIKIVNKILFRAEHLIPLYLVFLRSRPMLNLYLMLHPKRLIRCHFLTHVRIDVTGRGSCPSWA